MVAVSLALAPAVMAAVSVKFSAPSSTFGLSAVVTTLTKKLLTPAGRLTLPLVMSRSVLISPT